ncbi:HAMP domain-containing protein [Marinobacter sp.]|uniref:HAMP domain-containing protein n=1 Tax=Marinobacter sp. TaxID=50741 RepID=UPI0026084695|nr:HAMP domain-containing protein [Marinobacter sp.]
MTNTMGLARIRHLLRSSQVRLALGLVAVFVIVNFATLGFAWLQLLSKSEDQINLTLEQQVARLSETNDPGTFGALIETEAADVDPKQRVIVFNTPDGRSFGNARAEMRSGEVDLRARDASGELSDDGYSFRTKAMASGVLIVGESRSSISDLRETFVGLLSFAIFPTLLISLGAGVWMALVSARRVRHIESTLAQLTRGDLSARVPSADHNDDLSRIGAGINRMGGLADKREK